MVQTANSPDLYKSPDVLHDFIGEAFLEDVRIGNRGRCPAKSGTTSPVYPTERRGRSESTSRYNDGFFFF